jgi:hypothetical protein
MLLSRSRFVAAVQTYPVRTSHRVHLNPVDLERILRTHFETAEQNGDAASTSFGALARLVVRASGRELSVEVTMNPKVSEEVARDTIARYNRFLEEATGYSAKERARRLRKSATAPGSGD